MKKEGNLGIKNKASQITVFVIIALVIIGSIAGYFVARNFYQKAVPSSIAPVYNYYLSCLGQAAKDGASLLGSQAGYIELPEFEPGSEYAPFSSQLAFMGLGVPYWHYLSGNGIKKEQMPTRKQMEAQLAKYVSEEITNKCNFTNFIGQGYKITVKEPNAGSAKAAIGESSISVSLSQQIEISYEDASVILSSHSIKADSRLGEFYNLAVKVYNYEKASMFLENYSLDVLYNYAPVEGVAFNCSPAVWSPYAVAGNLKNALSANIQAIKMQGDYYISRNKYTPYFIAGRESGINLKNEQISFLYSPNWPSRIEIWPTKNNIMMAEPIGTQAGLGVLGFCYTPYKFVYDVYFPVLVQIYNPGDASEIFQFPFAVVISKNMPREALASEFAEQEETMCEDRKRTSDLTINTYNVNLEPVEAYISFKCLNDECSLGSTKTEKIGNESIGGISSLNAKVPGCYNAVLTAKSAGYKEKQYIVSTNKESLADIVLDRLYKINVEVYVDGKPAGDLAVLTFTEKLENITGSSTSLVYPLNKETEIAEGDYDFDLKVYKSGAITIPAASTRQCIQVPRSSLLGLFGMTEEKCSDINIPSQTLSNVLSAGGKLNQYITPTELERAKILKVYATSIKTPASLEEYSAAYDEIELKKISIEFA